ncbi:glycosyltransferase [Pedobacter sp. PLR]|uniref:glycosyltransferase n=1 Tax=Pedobacter sp. PLR TaxID=2994465 RepID=UPI002247C1E7|nr:glycosyltransferase [Pedobacter sp. PLR]MCX2453243.1 glycosyltransferase [Pedobacter sp. PLR]
MKNIEKQSPAFHQKTAATGIKEQFAKPKLLVLVVLYKKMISESPTIKTLLLQHRDLFEIELVIWDNSPAKCPEVQINELEKDFGQFQYRWTAENTWLSKLYNQVLSAHTYDYVLLLDQDTNIPPYYFDKLNEALFKFPKVALFLPLVLHQKKVVSPGSWVYFKGKHWKKIKTGIIPAKNVLAITSGMVISAKMFGVHKMKFDERLSLYGIDTGFMLNFSKFEKQLCVLPIKFAHDTVLWSNPSADVMLGRFRNLKSAWPKILSDRPVARVLVYFYSMAVSFKMALKYQDTRFLK